MAKVFLDILLHIVSFFIKDIAKRQEFEREIKRQIEQYNKETMVSADIRERNQDTEKRLRDRFKQ
jgi:uncharacterized membrane protein YciS (DUF1049 family)